MTAYSSVRLSIEKDFHLAVGAGEKIAKLYSWVEMCGHGCLITVQVLPRSHPESNVVTLSGPHIWIRQC